MQVLFARLSILAISAGGFVTWVCTETARYVGLAAIGAGIAGIVIICLLPDPPEYGEEAESHLSAQ